MAYPTNLNILIIANIIAALFFCNIICNDTAVVCQDKAWWAIVPVNSTVVLNIIPKDVHLLPPSQIPFALPPGTHPILFEFGHQRNCTPTNFPLVKTTFYEFKVEIPYTTTKRNGVQLSPVMDKPFVFVTSKSDQIGSERGYGLPTFLANITSSQNRYDVHYNNSFVNALFTPTSTFSPTQPNFAIYETINKYPWLCRNYLSLPRCAYNLYDWSSIEVRGSKMEMKVGKGIFGPNFPASVFTTDGINNNAIGTAEVIVTVNITNPVKCKNTSSNH